MWKMEKANGPGERGVYHCSVRFHPLCKDDCVTLARLKMFGLD